MLQSCVEIALRSTNNAESYALSKQVQCRNAHAEAPKAKSLARTQKVARIHLHWQSAHTNSRKKEIRYSEIDHCREERFARKVRNNSVLQ